LRWDFRVGKQRLKSTGKLKINRQAKIFNNNNNNKKKKKKKISVILYDNDLIICS
jgi:hypothetical protein